MVALRLVRLAREVYGTPKLAISFIPLPKN
ncbi:MAG: hypothetical protein QOE70_5111 [Chthoniobacter sp.]|jgi:hypothetical protein|nr:hypothetical protein [Chthoniobacter sp.]